MARRRSRGSSVWFSLNRVPVGRRGIESPGQFERLRPSHVPQSCSALRYQTRRAAMDSRSEHQLLLLHVVDAAGEIGEFPVAGGRDALLRQVERLLDHELAALLARAPGELSVCG